MSGMQTKLNLAGIGLVICGNAQVLFYFQLMRLEYSLWLGLVASCPFFFVFYLSALQGIPPIRLLRFFLFFAVAWYSALALLDEIIYFSPQAEQVPPPGGHPDTVPLQIAIFIGFLCCIPLIRAYILLGRKGDIPDRLHNLTYWMEWRGPAGSTPPDDATGCYYNPGVGEVYHPDASHVGTAGAHWDFVASDGTCSRIMPPNGTVVPKKGRAET